MSVWGHIIISLKGNKVSVNKKVKSMPVSRLQEYKVKFISHERSNYQKLSHLLLGKLCELAE